MARTIYNLSGETFRLAEIRGEKPGQDAIWETPAGAAHVGDVLEPGDRLHVELLYTGSNGARLLWRKEGNNSEQTDIAMNLVDQGKPLCSTTSTFACYPAPDQIGMFDRKGPGSRASCRCSTPRSPRRGRP